MAKCTVVIGTDPDGEQMYGIQLSTGEESDMFAFSTPAILQTDSGTWYCMMYDADEKPQVWKVKSADLVACDVEEIDLTDEDSDDDESDEDPDPDPDGGEPVDIAA